jgi:endonuclease/exonuclease/phosphatase family metal-dependent hydrolase
MKKHVSIIALALILLINSACATTTLEFMSRNARRMGDDPVEHQWDNRKQLLCDQILARNPAIIGFQEVVVGQQLEDLKSGLPGYMVVGDIGRKGFATGWYQKWVSSLDKAKNESNPIFYDPEQVNLITHGIFGINPSGRFSKASLPRVCVWATFEDPESLDRFTVYNTHLSSSGAWGLKDGTDLIRTKQVGMILKHINKKKTGKKPVIIMGDFNTRFEGVMKKKLTKAGFKYGRDIAPIKKGPEETRTGWNDEQLKIIDHIFVRGADVAEYEVLTSPKGQYPSDHRPVCAKVIMPETVLE